MPYTQVDHDAIKRAVAMAPLLGLSPQQAVGGLTMLWAWCWAEKRSRVSALQLEGFLGCGDPRLIEALTDFEFIEPVENMFRVRGAERFLHVQEVLQEGRRKGGLAAKANLRQGTRLAPGLAPAGSRLAPGSSAGKFPGSPRLLSPTPTPTPTQEEETRSKPLSVSTDRAGEVFEYWRVKLRPKAHVFDDRTRKAVTERLREGFTVDDLKQAIDGCASNPHNQGVNDKGKRYDSLELICRNGANVTRFQSYLDKPASGFKPGGFQRADGYTEEDRGPKGDVDLDAVARQLGWNDLDRTQHEQPAERRPASLILKPPKPGGP